MNDNLGTGHKVLKREIVVTADGSTSLKIPELDEMYHSKKGAVQESQFVYIDNGMSLIKKPKIDILEIGMGTGLNVALTIKQGSANNVSIHYDTLEPYPLTKAEQLSLNYEEILGFPVGMMSQIHNSNTDNQINADFNLSVYAQKLEDWEANQLYDVIYFDAFAPNKQKGPWVLSNLKKLYACLKAGGVLTTYCAQGQFKRDLKSIGFEVTNPPGPMGKREITVAYK